MTLVPVLAAVAVPAVFGALHWYLYRRLIRQTTSHGTRARRAGAALFVVGPLLAGTAVVGGFTSMPMAVERVVAWPGYVWLAVFLYLLLGVLAGEVVRPLLNLWLTHRHRASAVVVDPATPAADLLSRRLFVSRAIAVVAATAAVGVVGHGTRGVLNGPSVKRIVVPLAKLSRALHSFRIAVVSDIHLGPLLGRLLRPAGHRHDQRHPARPDRRGG